MGSPSKFFKTHDMYVMYVMHVMYVSYICVHMNVSLADRHMIQTYIFHEQQVLFILEVVRSCMNGSKVTVVLI